MDPSGRRGYTCRPQLCRAFWVGFWTASGLEGDRRRRSIRSSVEAAAEICAVLRYRLDAIPWGAFREPCDVKDDVGDARLFHRCDAAAGWGCDAPGKWLQPLTLRQTRLQHGPCLSTSKMLFPSLPSTSKPDLFPPSSAITMQRDSRTAIEIKDRPGPSSSLASPCAAFGVPDPGVAKPCSAANYVMAS